MRQVILDTETTGLDPDQGHRIVEIAAVEIVNRRLTTNRFQRYLNPGRPIDPAAQEVHGLSLEFLKDMPCFPDIVGEFLEFIKDAELIIHNAAFDEAFLNAELARLSLGKIRTCCRDIIDTLSLARSLHPGQKNNLDALCSRYQVNNAHRQVHGALLDAELLAAVYLAMTRGQESLMIESATSDDMGEEIAGLPGSFTVIYADEAEQHAHRILLDDIAVVAPCLWQSLTLPAIQPDESSG